MIFGVILAYCAIFPILYFFGPEIVPWLHKTSLSYLAIMYYLVFNTLALLGIGYCLSGYLTYPYSNSTVNKHEKMEMNKKFGLEFGKCVLRVSQVIQDMLETQGTANTSAILQEDNEKSGAD